MRGQGKRSVAQSFGRARRTRTLAEIGDGTSNQSPLRTPARVLTIGTPLMIAISYRREDSLPVAGRLYDRLQSEFGRDKVFMDFDSIPYGVDFREHIKQIICQSKVLIAIIGPNWMGRRKRRGRRIDDPADFVRLEIAYALEHKLPIIPILVSNTQMPRSEELPQDIQALAFRNGLSLDVGIDFHHHAERLSAAINRLLTASAPPVGPEKAAQISPPPEAPRPPSEPRLEPTISLPAPIPGQPVTRESTVAPVESAPSPPVRDEKLAKPMITVPSPTEDRQSRPSIDLSKQIDAVRTAVGRFLRGVGKVGSAITSGLSRLFGSIGNGGRRVFRSFAEQIQRRRKTLTISTAVVIGLAIVGAAIYWGVQSGSFERLFFQAAQFFKAREVAKVQPTPPPPSVVPRAVETPTVALAAPSATPAQLFGSLFIDSAPQGEAFEIVDSISKHHIGKTPRIVHELPVGYTQVIFRREGFAEHIETVLVSASSQPFVKWNFPEADRLAPPAPANPSATPAIVAANETSPPSSPIPSATSPAAQSEQAWQSSISDFVKQFLAVNQSQDANATVAFYAPSVDYFGSRGKDHAFILRDVQKYNTQWPARRDSIDGDIRIEEKIPNQQYQASFKLNFYAENAKTSDWSKGQVATTLDVNIIDGSPKIVAINQKRLQPPQSGRGKGPRPADMETPGPITPAKLTKVETQPTQAPMAPPIAVPSVPELSTVSAGPKLVADAVYEGTIHVENDSSVNVPLLIKIGSDLKSGTMTQSGRRGDVVVKFTGVWDGATLHAVTAELISEAKGIQWEPESFTLRFTEDGKRGSYECNSRGRIYSAELSPGVLSRSEVEALAIFAPKPDYPIEARRRHITGSGVCMVTIDPNGNVIDATMARSIGNPILDNAAVSAFRRWRFKPGTNSKIKIPIDFTMTGASR